MDRGYSLRSSGVKAAANRHRVFRGAGGNSDVDSDNSSSDEEQYEFQRAAPLASAAQASSSTTATKTTTTTTTTMSASRSSSGSGTAEVARTTSRSTANSSYINQTPVIQRTLYTRAEELDGDEYDHDLDEEQHDVDEDFDDDEDEDEDEEIDEDDDEYVEVGSSALFRRHESAHDDSDGDDDDGGSDRAVSGRRASLRSSSSSNAAAKTPGFFERHRVFGSGFVRRATDTQRGRNFVHHVRQLWQFVLRNSFVAANVLWLLAPLGCFVIAIAVPQYLTTAIRYVDVLTTRASGAPALAGAFEKGSMRSIVQEIVDVKLSVMNEELALLRSTLQTHEREVDALRVLHESLRHALDEQQRKFSLADSSSALSVHVERVIAKHTDELWTRVIEKTATIKTELQTTAQQQMSLQQVVREHESEMVSIRQLASGAGASVNTDELLTSQRKLREELSSWQASLQEELQSGMQREVRAIEERVSKSLLAEKQRVLESVESLQRTNAADPALVALIEGALVEAEAKKAGRVDYAALANGATVVYSKTDLLSASGYSPLQTLSRAFGFHGGRDADGFTSSSFCKEPLPLVGAVLSPGELPWWLSRHNGRPETALSETMEIGSCWGIAGSSGKLSVKFPTRIIADAITIDHIPERVASDFRSAPKDLTVVGLVGDRARNTVDAIPFGNFSYARGGAASQTFALTSPVSQRSAIDGITLEISSNHGHDAYTCLYRFRVHGMPV